MENRQIDFTCSLVEHTESGEELLRFTIPGHSEWDYLTDLEGNEKDLYGLKQIKRLRDRTIPHPPDPTAPLVIPQDVLDSIKEEIKNPPKIEKPYIPQIYGIYDD